MTGPMSIVRPCGFCGELHDATQCRQCSCCGELTGNNDFELCGECFSAEESRAARVECEVCGRTYDKRTNRGHHHSIPMVDR